jgi:cytochrome c
VQIDLINRIEVGVFMKKRSFFGVLALAAITVAVPGISHSEERGNIDDAKTLVSKALAHIKKVGPDQAFKDFTEDKVNWVNKDVYIFGLNMKGDQVAHGVNPKQVGKNFWEFKDANGKLVFQEFSAVAAKGSGLVEYEWAHPTTKKIETKISYIAKVPGTDYYIGAGAYK